MHCFYMIEKHSEGSNTVRLLVVDRSFVTSLTPKVVAVDFLVFLFFQITFVMLYRKKCSKQYFSFMVSKLTILPWFHLVDQNHFRCASVVSILASLLGPRSRARHRNWVRHPGAGPRDKLPITTPTCRRT